MKNPQIVLGVLISGLLLAGSPVLAASEIVKPIRPTRSFQIITPNGGETWVSDDENEMIHLRMPTEQRYWVTHYLIPQGSTPIATSTLPFNKEFGGYNIGGFSLAKPTIDVIDFVNIEEVTPSGTYRLRSYLTTYKHGEPTGPTDYLQMDESDASFMIVAPQPAPIMDLSVFNTEAVSPVYGDEDRADYTIEFSIEADGHDLYIPKNAQRDTTPDGSHGFEYVIGRNNGTSTLYNLGITDASVLAEGSIAGDTTTHFKVADGDARDFELLVALNNAGATSGYYSLRVVGITALVGSTTVVVIDGLEDFETDYVFVDNTDQMKQSATKTQESESKGELMIKDGSY